MSSKVKMDYKNLFINLLKMIFVGLLTFVITYISARFMANCHIITRLVAISIEMLTVYVGLSCLFKVNYVGEILNRVLGKFKRV